MTPERATLNAQSPIGPNAPGYVSTLRLTADVSLSDGSHGQTVTWTSSNPAQAVVAEDGTVTIPSTATPGEVTITAEAGGHSDRAYITITTIGDIDLTVE